MAEYDSGVEVSAKQAPSVVQPRHAPSSGQVVRLKVSPDLETALRAISPVVTAAATEKTSEPDPNLNLNRAIDLVQRSALAMQSMGERLRKTETYAMECIHKAQQQLAAADEKIVRSEAVVQELQNRVNGLENALSNSNQMLAQEREEHQHAREWLNYLHDDIIKQLDPAAKLLEDLNSKPGPLLAMLESKVFGQLSTSSPPQAKADAA